MVNLSHHCSEMLKGLGDCERTQTLQVPWEPHPATPAGPHMTRLHPRPFPEQSRVDVWSLQHPQRRPQAQPAEGLWVCVPPLSASSDCVNCVGLCRHRAEAQPLTGSRSKSQHGHSPAVLSACKTVFTAKGPVWRAQITAAPLRSGVHSDCCVGRGWGWGGTSGEAPPLTSFQLEKCLKRTTQLRKDWSPSDIQSSLRTCPGPGQSSFGTRIPH